MAYVPSLKEGVGYEELKADDRKMFAETYESNRHKVFSFLKNRDVSNQDETPSASSTAFE